MEYTELSAYRLPTGYVTTWTPTATEDNWTTDTRPLSCNHEAHLRHTALNAAQYSGPSNTPSRGDNWIGTALRIHREFDASAFTETLRLWLARHEAYRTTAISNMDGELHRRTLPADSVTVSAHQIGQMTDPYDALEYLEGHFASTVSAMTWPHLTVVTIQPDSDAQSTLSSTKGGPWFTVVFAADHAVMDAYTQIVSISELREIYAAQLCQRTPELPFPGSHIDYSGIEREAAHCLTADHPAVQRWRSFLCSSGNLPSPPRLPLLSEDFPRGAVLNEESQQVSASIWLLDEVDASVFGQISKQLGGSQMTGVLAALKLAVSRTNQDGENCDVLRYIMPMHTRTSPEFALSAGWFVGLMPVEDPMPRETTFAEAVPVTTAAVQENRDLVAYPYPRVAELIGVVEAPRFVVSFVDTRFIPGAEEWTPHDRTLRGVSYSPTDVYIWIVRTRHGLNISLRYPRDPRIRDTMRTLIAEYFTVLHNVVDTGNASSLPFTTPRRESLRRV